MKILHLLKSNKFSGAENVVLTIMQLFPEYEMIYASPDGPIKEAVTSHGYTFYSLDGTNIISVRKAIKDISPDIVHAHDFSMATNAAWASGTIPVIAHLHNNPPWLKTIHPKSVLFAASLPRIRQVISVSDSVENEFLFKSILTAKNIVIGNVVDKEKITNLSIAGEGGEKSDLLFLGRLSAVKNPLGFCKIVKETKKKIAHIKGVIVGDGELRDDVREFTNEHDLSGNIGFVGFQSNPYPYLWNTKILIMPSLWEGFGLAAIEALCLGKPVLCSGAGGLADIVDDSCGKICVSENDYVQEIIKLLGNRSYYKQKSINAKVRAERFCDMKEYKSKLEAIYAAAKSN